MLSTLRSKTPGDGPITRLGDYQDIGLASLSKDTVGSII